MKKTISIIGIIVLMFFTFLIGSNLLYSNPVGAAIGLDESVQSYATSSSVYVGKDIPTVVTNLSQGRSYLEISNLSGATSTAQVISCAINGATPVLYKGITIFASSTRIWTRDHIPATRMTCISSGASSTISIIER